MFDLNSKTAIITGASSGMGYAMALLFAKSGANVIAIARREERLAKLAKSQDNITPITADITKNEDIEKVIKTTVEKFGKIDILVNNAGIMDDMVPLDKLSDELWDKVFSVNVDGVMKMSRAAIKQMLKAKSGSIVNIASVGGLNGCRAGTAYTASKHAVIGLTKNIAYMYANEGIRCNAICPGGVNTEIAQNSMKNPDQFGLGRAMSGINLNPRSGEPEEIASVALFLASEAASLVNGAIVTADAGWTAY